MTQTYKVEGMTCMGCVAGVTKKLQTIAGVQTANVSLEEQSAALEASRQIQLSDLQQVLGAKYTVSEIATKSTVPAITEDETTDIKALYPLFLVFSFLIGAVLLRQVYLGNWNVMNMMTNFMGGFFIIFSFFKLLDLRGFRMAFQSYDPITKMWSGYGYVYPFIELGLGIAFLFGVPVFWLALITLVVVGIGTIGVAQTILNKQQIQCACLGTVFNLPMTKVTLTENSIMLIMAVFMLFI